MFYYVDTSIILSLAFREPAAASVLGQLNPSAHWFSSYLLEAELRSAFAREKRQFDENELKRVSWVITDRRLTAEMSHVLAQRVLRGADLWHVACAVYLQKTAGEIEFATLDLAQRHAAKASGLRVTNLA